MNDFIPQVFLASGIDGNPHRCYVQPLHLLCEQEVLVRVDRTGRKVRVPLAKLSDTHYAGSTPLRILKLYLEQEKNP